VSVRDLMRAIGLVEYWIFGFGLSARMRGNTSKGLDKNVVVRVILHAQCSLQRKEAK
jgi:hypothetical protein